MSFFASCATSEPSTNSTKEWMSDCGWITASIRSPGRPKRKCASITSRPLFIIVAESIVIFGPIFQVGCASASSTVIASKVSRRRSRNGPPEAVSTSRRASPGAPARRAWWIALCSESTGTSSAPLFFASARMSSPATTSGLLVGEREALAGAHRRVAPSAGRARRPVRRRPCPRPDGRRPRRGLPCPRRSGSRARPAAVCSRRDTSSARSIETSFGRNRAACSASFSIERPAASATTRNRSGMAATTSSDERPIEPVEPRIERDFMANGSLY